MCANSPSDPWLQPRPFVPRRAYLRLWFCWAVQASGAAKEGCVPVHSIDSTVRRRYPNYFGDAYTMQHRNMHATCAATLHILSCVECRCGGART